MVVTVSRQETMNIRNTLTIAAAATALIFPAAASAHVDISPSEAPAGKPTAFAFTVGHDCEGAATTGLDVQVPAGVSGYSAKSIPGWKAVTRGGLMKWRGGPHPDGVELALPFRATVYGKMGDQLPFKVIQLCEGGAETAWIQTGGGKSEGDEPAPALALTSTRVAPPPPVSPAGEGQSVVTEPSEAASAGSDDDAGGVGIGPIVGLVLIAASITAFVVIRRGKSSSS